MEFKNEIEQFMQLAESDKAKEEQILEMITARVEELLDTEPDLLMSYLYRLDVLEEKIKAVLNQPKGLSIPQALAKLIWDRQKLRLALRKKYSKGEGSWEIED